jgi:predicted site-specific integrase-resolvase
MLRSGKAAKILGVHVNTLRNWANKGEINYVRTKTGHRLYDIDSFLHKEKQIDRAKIIYARVSSKGQKDDLSNQIKYLRERYPHHEFIEDFGSGLNFKRKGFKALLDRILTGAVEEVVISHRDRLCRFGFELIQSIADKNNCKLVVLSNTQLSPQEELVQDLISIIHVFSCRIYGLRKYSDKIKKDPDISKFPGDSEI